MWEILWVLCGWLGSDIEDFYYVECEIRNSWLAEYKSSYCLLLQQQETYPQRAKMSLLVDG